MSYSPGPVGASWAKTKSFKAKENRWKAKKTPKKRLKLWKMNGNQGIHRLAPWNKQTTRTATQIKKKYKTQKKKNNSPAFFPRASEPRVLPIVNEVRSPKIEVKLRFPSRPAQPFRTKWGSIVKNWGKSAISRCPPQPFRTKRGSIVKNWAKIAIWRCPPQPLSHETMFDRQKLS